MKIYIKAKYSFLIFFFMLFCAVFSAAETCSKQDAVEHRFIAKDCDTITKTRTCCKNWTWSDWDESCPSSFDCDDSKKPGNKQNCSGGTQTREVSCDTSIGEWKTGAWGECVCASGYASCNGTCKPKPSEESQSVVTDKIYYSDADAYSLCRDYCQSSTAQDLLGSSYLGNVRCSWYFNYTGPDAVCGCSTMPSSCYVTAFHGVTTIGEERHCSCVVKGFVC